jgi:phosphohistidine phosphatase SixA
MNVYFMGHEPLLSSTISVLLAGTGGAIRLKKGGLCCLQVDNLPPRKSAVLQWALTPKQLRLLAR